MSILTPKDLNNQIVSMRSEVRRSIVHHVHKLTANIKQLRAKSGTDAQVQKNFQKSDSLVDEIKIIKKIKLDDVSIMAISNTEDYLKLLIRKPIVSSSTKAVAKLCFRQNIQVIIKEFKEKYPNFYAEVNLLLEKRFGRKNKKNKKKRRKEKGDKIQDSRFSGLTEESIVKSDSDSESVPELIPVRENSRQNDHYHNEVLNVSNFKLIQNSDSKLPNQNDFKQNKVKNIKKILVYCGSDKNADNTSLKDDKSVGVTQKKMKREKVKSRFFSSVENSGRMFHDENESGIKSDVSDSEKNLDIKRGTKFNYSPSLKLKKKLKSDEIIGERFLEQSNLSSIDPFFMTTDNQEYRTYFQVEKSISENKDVKVGGNNKFQRSPSIYRDSHGSCSVPLDSKSNFGGKKQSFKAERLQYKIKGIGRTLLSARDSNRHINSKRDVRNSNNNRKGTKPDFPVSVLHPSWEAKRKMSAEPVQFQGKKIIFDED